MLVIYFFYVALKWEDLLLAGGGVSCTNDSR